MTKRELLLQQVEEQILSLQHSLQEARMSDTELAMLTQKVLTCDNCPCHIEEDYCYCKGRDKTITRYLLEHGDEKV